MRRDIRRMAFKLGISCAERSFCFLAILIAVFAATLRAQTSGENDAYSFSSSVLPLSLCGQSADGCLLSSAALAQDGSRWEYFRLVTWCINRRPRMALEISRGK